MIAPLAGIPQRTSCGPIEAWALAFRAFSVAAFRNEQVAAPLKRRDQQILPLSPGPFRNEQVAAPLKRPLAYCVRGHDGAFRNEQVAAPLKQGRPA